MDVRFCDEIDFGFGWIAPEPRRLLRASHALADGGKVWLLDPVAGDGVEERVRALGEPAGVIQLLDRHSRDSAKIARRLGVPHHEVPFERVEGSPFDVVRLVRIPSWREIALWWPEIRALVCADALRAARYFRAPGELLAVHPLVRLTPPRRLPVLAPGHMLVDHGSGVHGDEAAPALAEALSSARRRAPRWVAGLVRKP